MNGHPLSQAWRTGAIGPQPEPLAYGSVELWPDEYQAFVAGRRISLTPREFEVLHVLVARGGHVVTKRRIHDAVWGAEHHAGARDRSVDVYVRKLRGKFRDVAPEWRFIHTHFGIGYRFAPEPKGQS